jgi:hypothetical protein
MPDHGEMTGGMDAAGNFYVNHQPIEAMKLEVPKI